MIFGDNGLTQSSFNLGDLNGLNGFTLLTLFEANFAAMRPIAAMHDMNGDGANDFAIGKQFAGSNSAQTGAVYVIYGRPQDLIFEDSFE